MKKVLFVSTIKGIAGRRCLTGLFGYVNEGRDWNVRILQDQDDIDPSALASAAHDVDGIIVSYNRLTPAIGKLLARPVPVVQVHDPDGRRLRRRRNFVLLQNDDTRVGEMAAEYLHGRGSFRSYVYLATERPTAWSDQHRDGFTRTLARYGIRPHEAREDEALGDFLRRLERPVAVFCATDPIAVNALAACRKSGLRIPQQVAILGVDDDGLLCESSRPTLSSVQTDDTVLGREAARELDRLMRGRTPASPAGRLIPPTGIAERESTKSVPPAGHLIDRALRHIAADPSATVADIARKLGVSAPLLRLRFRETHGRSLRDEILDARLALTLQTLRTTAMPLSRVAETCGFASASHLSHFVKERTGRPPHAHRESTPPIDGKSS